MKVSYYSNSGVPNATTKYALTGCVRLTTIDGDTVDGQVEWADTVGIAIYLDFIGEIEQRGNVSRFFPWENVAYVDRLVKREVAR